MKVFHAVPRSAGEVFGMTLIDASPQARWRRLPVAVRASDAPEVRDIFFQLVDELHGCRAVCRHA